MATVLSGFVWVHNQIVYEIVTRAHSVKGESHMSAVYLGTECSESLASFPGLPVQNTTRVLFARVSLSLGTRLVNLHSNMKQMQLHTLLAIPPLSTETEHTSCQQDEWNPGRVCGVLQLLLQISSRRTRKAATEEHRRASVL